MLFGRPSCSFPSFHLKATSVQFFTWLFSRNACVEWRSSRATLKFLFPELTSLLSFISRFNFRGTKVRRFSRSPSRVAHLTRKQEGNVHVDLWPFPFWVSEAKCGSKRPQRSNGRLCFPHLTGSKTHKATNVLR